MASALPMESDAFHTPRGHRPTGVAILAVLDFIAAAFLLFGGIAMMFLGAAFGTLFGGAFGGGEGAAAGGALGTLVGAMLGFALLASGVLCAVVGYALWSGKGWGWWLAVVFSALSVVFGLLELLSMDFSSLLSVALSGFIVWYLTAPGVQKWFGLSVKVPWHKTA